jgi:threonine/homoserine/homoserine lactone efflux protein
VARGKAIRNLDMLPEQFVAFFVFAVAAAVTPGPSNVLVMATGAQVGIVRGTACLAGVVAGMALLMSAAMLGLGGVIQVYPMLLNVMRWGGSAFLLWLAWKVAFAPPMNRNVAADPVGFWRALAFQWVNPKSWIVSVSAAAAFAGEAAGWSAIGQALAFGTTFALAATPSCAVWLVAGAAVHRWLVNERASRIFNVTMGGLLAASVLLIVR